MHNAKTYLLINGIGYILLGLWCAVAPEQTSALVGFSLLPPKGLPEYYAVYGGLEAGLGAFYLLSMRTSKEAAISLSVCLYGGIVFFRTLSFFLYGPTADLGWLLYSLEVSLFLWALALVSSSKR